MEKALRLLHSSVMCAGKPLLFAQRYIEKGAVLAPGTVQIATELGTTIPRIALLAGYYLLAVGATGYPFKSFALSKLSPFISAFATKYGKRPVFVFSSTMATIGVIVGCFANGYQTLLAARVLDLSLRVRPVCRRGRLVFCPRTRRPNCCNSLHISRRL